MNPAGSLSTHFSTDLNAPIYVSGINIYSGKIILKRVARWNRVLRRRAFKLTAVLDLVTRPIVCG